jgi:hypothetical protein
MDILHAIANFARAAFALLWMRWAFFDANKGSELDAI